MRSIFIILFYLSSIFCTAQENLDKQWVVGYPPDGGDSSLFHAYLMDFNDDTLKFIKIPDAQLVTNQTTASICDNDGNLLLYSNGCQIHNGKFKLIEGCENVNPGIAWDLTCINFNSAYYPTLQSQLILPVPEKDNQFIYLSHRKEYSEKYNYQQYHYWTEFYRCHIIDMSLNNGNGKSIKDFDLEFPDVVKGYNLAACKHANGIDWWIITFSFNTKKIYRTLLTKEGLSGPWEQDGGPPRDSNNDFGQSVFSPNGKKFACTYSNSNKAWVMDFDRKTGLFSNLVTLEYESKKDWEGRGISFSPNSKLVYVSANYYLFQFNADAPDIQQSKLLIAENDLYALPGWPNYINFGFQQLGPDGKIYVGQFTGGIRQWSVVNNPDVVGNGCNFLQHSLLFPCWSAATPAIQPNFQLGKDTTTNTLNNNKTEFKINSWFSHNTKFIKSLIQFIPFNIDNVDYIISDISGRTLIKKTYQTIIINTN